MDLVLPKSGPVGGGGSLPDCGPAVALPAALPPRLDTPLALPPSPAADGPSTPARSLVS